MRRSPPAGDAPQRLTLGGLHRSLLERLGLQRDAVIDIHFEQRSAVSALSAPEAGSQGLFVARRFEARMVSHGGRIESAVLTTSGMSKRPHARVWLGRDGDRYAYSVDGVRFGPLEGRPDLFDLARFERRLDDVIVGDVSIEQVPRDEHRTVIVLDADVQVDAFRRLLAVFASGSGGTDDDMDLRSYSVALTSADDVALDYWWSLVGSEIPAGDATVYRRTIACHVQVAVAPLDAPASQPVSVVIDASLPAASHIDAVWRLARSAVTEERPAAPAKRSRRPRRKSK